MKIIFYTIIKPVLARMFTFGKKIPLKRYFPFLTLIFFISCNNVKDKDAAVYVSDSVTNVIPPGYTNLRQSANLKDVLCQCWENKEDRNEAKEYGTPGDFEWVFRGYCFYKDGSVVKYPRGYMEVGKWDLDEESRPLVIKIKLDYNETDTVDLAMLTPVVLKLKSGYNGLQEYSGTGLRPVDITRDPLYPSNNQWRFHPEKSENDAQIRARVKGCIHFFVLFYQNMIDTKAAFISFNGYPSCFTWYSGGIYMQKESELQKKWISCFYNKSDAMKGYALATRLLQQKYNWPKNEKNWLKLNLAVLQQMESRIDVVN